MLQQFGKPGAGPRSSSTSILVFIDDADALPGRNERNHPHDGPGKATVLSLGLQQRARQIGILRLSAYSRQPTIVRRGPRL